MRIESVAQHRDCTYGNKLELGAHLSSVWFASFRYGARRPVTPEKREDAVDDYGMTGTRGSFRTQVYLTVTLRSHRHT